MNESVLVPVWVVALRQRWDEMSMRRDRAGYYAYLAERMRAGGGTRSLRRLFEDDARRYGMQRLRGRLSAQWAQRCGTSGGDLELLWHDVFPRAELRLLRVAQQAGGSAVPDSLMDLAGVVALVRQARTGVWQTLLAAVVAVSVLLAIYAAVPLWTAPRLAAMFGDMPVAFHGSATRRLFGLADILRVAWPWLPPLLLLLAMAVMFSFTRLAGAPRLLLERLAPWRIYRDVHALQLLALLQVLLRPRAGQVMPLRDLLTLLWDALPAWLRWHVDQMRDGLAAGGQAQGIFATGLFDDETRWMLDDLVAVGGLGHGLARVRTHIEGRMLAGVLARARFWRWVLLIFSVSGVLALLFWHYAVIDELRQALASFHVVG